MAEFMGPAQIGNDILDIGSRKARRERGADPMVPLSALMMGGPAQFDIPNVSNVRFFLLQYCFGMVENVVAGCHFRSPVLSGF